MFRLALKNAVANRSRFALTGLAVILSVAFLTATLVLSDSMTGTAADDIAAANAGIDAVVEGDTIAEDGGGPGEVAEITRETLSAGLVARVVAVDGVHDAAAETFGFAKLVDDGQAVGSGTRADVGRNWIDDPDLNPFHIVEGVVPSSTDEVAVDRAIANESGLAVGDNVELLTATGVHEVTITGIAAFGPADAAPAQRTTFFADGAAQPVLDQSGASQIVIDFETGADSSVVIAALAAVMPEASVSSGSDYIAAQQSAVTSPLTFVSIFLLAFAAIATVVGITIIYNTFTIAINQRQRELALLRVVGGQRRQVMRSVMAEAALIGIVATAIGVGLGIAGVGVLRAVMTGLGLSFLTGPTAITTVTIGIGATVGLFVTLASAWVPARRAAATAPIEALRDSAVETESGSRIRAWSGLTCLAMGGIGMATALYTGSTLLVASTLLLIPGVALAGPVLVNAAVQLGRPVLTRIAGVEGSIAARNLRRNPRRASSTSLALTLGVATVAFFAILAASIDASASGDLNKAIIADHVITSVSPEMATIDPMLANRLGAIDDVDAVAPVSLADGSADGDSAKIAGIDPDAMSRVYDLGLVGGSLQALNDGGVAVLDDGTTPPSVLGNSIGIALGDGTAELPVVAIVSRSLGGFDAPTHFVSHETLHSLQRGLLDNIIYVSTAGGNTTAGLREAVAATPGSLLETRTSYIAGASTEVDSFRNFIYSMLSLTLIIALAGIANTTTLAVGERAREIGLLRAVGATRKGVRRVIRLEAALLAVAGTVIGLAIAIAGGWTLISVVGGSELPAVAMPWLSLTLIGAGAVIGGTTAAAYPAWRASRLPVLDAMAVA